MSDRQASEPQVAFEERILSRIPLEILVLSLAIAGGALIFFNLQTSLFVFAGGVFSASGFLWLKQALTRFLGRARPKAVRAGLLFYLARLILIIAVFSIIILVFPRMILAFVAGFSTIILVFFVEAVRAIAQMRQWKS